MVEPFEFPTTVKLAGTKVIGMLRRIPTGSKTSTVTIPAKGALPLGFSTERWLEIIRRLLIYDPDAGDFRHRKTMKLAGCHQDNGYIRISVGGCMFQAHRLAWFYVHGEYVMVDHKDRCRWHNEISNLRKTTYQMNAANRSYIGNNSGVKGVHAKRGKFEAGIKVDQKRIYLGIFNTLEEAQNAYIQAAKRYFGEFANG